MTKREPVGRDCLADFRDRFADEFPAPASSTSIITSQDGTVIIADAETGKSASGRTLKEAEANFRVAS